MPGYNRNPIHSESPAGCDPQMSVLVPKPDPDVQQTFEAQRAWDNVARLRIVSAIVVGVVLWFAAVNLTFIFAGSRDFTGFPHYTVLYVSFFGLNVYTLVRTFQLQRQAQSESRTRLERLGDSQRPAESQSGAPTQGPAESQSRARSQHEAESQDPARPQREAESQDPARLQRPAQSQSRAKSPRRAIDVARRDRYLERLVTVYLYLMLLLGASISLADLTEYGHAMVYALTLLLTSAFLLTDAKQLAFPLVLSATLLIVGLFLRLPAGEERMHILQELFAYVPIAFVISRIVYSAHFNAWHSNVRLQREIGENERLNKELREANRRLETLARTDEVTGIANRRGLNMHLEKLLAASDGAVQLSLIMIDIDFFKEYNDIYGHRQGDMVLTAVANMLADLAAESSGFVSRWGGEEFLYVDVGLEEEKLLDVCRRIRDEIRAASIRHEGSPVSDYITLSQGACSQDVRSREDIDACLRRADRALYRAKSAGRNGYFYCDGSLADTVASEVSVT